MFKPFVLHGLLYNFESGQKFYLVSTSTEQKILVMVVLQKSHKKLIVGYSRTLENLVEKD